ncbi:MAG TPA: LuxR C-terminal-related transcriptional regulator [Streptosporangiaceae bacterium]|nr:LuxR C-terminal-related transcriptional regulator [Streptosporangiaceae bacterium]
MASVGDPILESKITPPDVPGWAIQRPRITKMIAEGTRWCPVTVLTGPVGAGKTMALALWTAAEPGPVAWVCLDEYNSRPGAFWSYVVAALQRSGVAVSGVLPGASRGRPAENLFLLRLASALAAQDPPVTLVLDDLHLIIEPKILNGLDFLVRSVGSSLRLVASARADPLLPVHRYRLTGKLADIQGSDLAFSAEEAGLLLAQHGCTLSSDSLECLMQQTEGWAAGLRLAAISMAAHPDPDLFVREQLAEDSALTTYLAEEILSTQPPEVRELLLSTSILEHVNADVASELAASRQAGRILADLAHASAFVQPIGHGWYRYHTLFAEMLRLTLRLERPDRIAALHRQAARWYERNGQLTEAVRHATEAGDWQLAASMVVDGLAIGEIIEPAESHSLADEFAGMPPGERWPEPQPYLVCAAVDLSAGRPELAVAALDAAERILDRLPSDQEAAARLAASTIRLAAARRGGDLAAAAGAIACAEALIGTISGGRLAQHAGIRAQVLSARGAVELWSGRPDEAVRILGSGLAAATAPGGERSRAACLGYLALAAALRGRLRRAVRLADQATACTSDGQHPSPVALVALAWVDLERHEQEQVRGRLKQVAAALTLSPDRLIGAIACLIAAYSALAEGRGDVTAQYVARARSGWDVPPWLERDLSLAESRASAAAGQIREALVLAAHDGVPERVRLQACLADARLSYHRGDCARGRQSLGRALRLAEPERLRLPFALERSWIGPVLRRDPDLAQTYRHLLPSALCGSQLPAPPDTATPGMTTAAAVEPLTEREREVLRHVSGMLTTAEIASELYISTNTVKTHIKNICHKLAATHRGEAVRRARQLQLI